MSFSCLPDISVTQQSWAPPQRIGQLCGLVFKGSWVRIVVGASGTQTTYSPCNIKNMLYLNQNSYFDLHSYSSSDDNFKYILYRFKYGLFLRSGPNVQATNKRLVSWNDFEHQRVLGLDGTVNSSLWHTTGLSLVSSCYVLSVLYQR